MTIPRHLLPLLLLLPGMVPAMGIRSFVALPLEKGGVVTRLVEEYRPASAGNRLTLNGALGLSGRQTLFLGLPLRLTPGGENRLGDAGLLYRHTVWQRDRRSGTSRLALLGGTLLPTGAGHDTSLQAGAVATFYRRRHEWDLDLLWTAGLGAAPDQGRYDIAWQYRLWPARHPRRGTPGEWDLDLELGGRWRQGGPWVHQLTAGLQWIHRRWVLEGAWVRDLNGPRDHRFLASLRLHF